MSSFENGPSHVTRRDFIGLAIASSVLPKIAFGQDVVPLPIPSNMGDLKAGNPELYNKIVVDSFTTAILNSGHQGVSALLNVYDIATNPGLSPLEREIALQQIHHYAKTNEHLDPELFGKIINTINPPVSGFSEFLHSVPTSVSWGIQTVAVLGGAYTVLYPPAAVALGVAGIVAEPALKAIVEAIDPSQPSIPRGSDQQFRQILEHVVAVAMAEPKMFEKGAKAAFFQVSGIDFQPESFDKAFRRSVENAQKLAGIDPKKTDVPKEETLKKIHAALIRLEKQMSEQSEKLDKLQKKNAGSPAAPARNPMADIDYVVGEIRGAGTILSAFASAVGVNPKSAKDISIAANEMANIMKVAALFQAGAAGPVALAAVYVQAAVTLISHFSGPSTDELILASLESAHRKLDALLNSTHRIEQRQIQILQSLSSIYKELQLGNLDATKRLNDVQESVDILLKRENLEVRQKELIGLLDTATALKAILLQPEDKRHLGWQRETQSLLSKVISFTELTSRKASFSGDPQLVETHSALGKELDSRDDFQLSLGFLPQIGSFLNQQSLASLGVTALANIPNPDTWAAGVSCYLEAISLSGGVGRDEKQLRQLWNSGMQIRSVILAATSPELISVATDQFLKNAGARRSDLKEPTPTKKEQWEVERSPVASFYRETRDFIIRNGFNLKEYSTKERDREKNLLPVDNKPNLYKRHGDYFGVGLRSEKSLDGLDRHLEIADCPIDAALRVKAIELTEIGLDEKYVFKRRIFGIRNTEPLSAAFVDFLTSQELSFDTDETKDRARTFRERIVGEGASDPTELLDVCETLAYFHARKRIKRELPNALEEHTRSLDFSGFDGLGTEVKFLGTLTRLRMYESNLPKGAERISDFPGIFSTKGIKEYLQRAILEYQKREGQTPLPTTVKMSIDGKLVTASEKDIELIAGEMWDPNTMAETITQDLCNELHSQCEDLMDLASAAPENKTYLLVDETLRRLAGYVEVQGVKLRSVI